MKVKIRREEGGSARLFIHFLKAVCLSACYLCIKVK